MTSLPSSVVHDPSAPAATTAFQPLVLSPAPSRATAQPAAPSTSTRGVASVPSTTIGAPTAPVEAATPSMAHLAQIADARRRGKPIRRAAGVAALNGWTLAAFAAITLLMSLQSIGGIITALALAAVAYFELRGAKELRRLDGNAPRRLAWNQLALGLLLATYAAVNIITSINGPGVYASSAAAAGDPQIAKMLEPIESLTRSITTAVYAVVGVVGVVVPGLTSVFYLRRRKMIEHYLEQTPTWIVNLQRMGSTL